MKGSWRRVMAPSNHLWGNIFKEKNEGHRDTRILLKKIPLFAALTKSELKEIVRLIHHRQYRNEEIIFWEDEPGVGMYVIQKGAVGIYKDYAKAEQKELVRLEPGDFFGEMALLEDDFRSATAVALGETDLYGLTHPNLPDLFLRKPQLGVKLLSTLANILARRLRKTNQDLQRLEKNLPAAEAKEKTTP
jgi:CRP/FNR family cyclic AMP-dependent transcriptional regulator